MNVQQDIAAIRQELATLKQKEHAQNAAVEAGLSQIIGQIHAIVETENAVLIEKGEGRTEILKGFWHGGLMVHKVPANKTTKDVTKSEGFGRIWN